jgi:creatinine amidohydrolase
MAFSMEQITLQRRREECRMAYLSPSELSWRLEDMPVLYFPIGSLEWHNEHLPLGTDTFHAEVIATRLCGILGGSVLPPFWFNTGGCHRSPATYYMPECHYSSVLTTICMGFREIPALLLVLINGHGGRWQHDAMENVALSLTRDTSFPMRVIAADPYRLGSNPWCQIDHANTGETSVAMELIPELVRMEQARTPDIITGEVIFEEKGMPTKEKGLRLWEAFLAEASSLIRESVALGPNP